MNNEYLKVNDNTFLIFEDNDKLLVSNISNENELKKILQLENSLENNLHLQNLLLLDINNCNKDINKIKKINIIFSLITIAQIIVINILVGFQLPAIIGTLIEMSFMRALLIPQYSTIKNAKKNKTILEKKINCIDKEINKLSKSINKFKTDTLYNKITNSKEIDSIIGKNLNNLISDEQLPLNEKKEYQNIHKIKKLIKKRDITTKL